MIEVHAAGREAIEDSDIDDLRDFLGRNLRPDLHLTQGIHGGLSESDLAPVEGRIGEGIEGLAVDERDPQAGIREGRRQAESRRTRAPDHDVEGHLLALAGRNVSHLRPPIREG